MENTTALWVLRDMNNAHRVSGVFPSVNAAKIWTFREGTPPPERMRHLNRQPQKRAVDMGPAG